MAKYQNKDTGAIIEAHSEIKGGAWIKLEEKKKPAKKKSESKSE